jgi:cytochrome P450
VGYALDSFGFVEDAVASVGSPYRVSLPGTDLYVLAEPAHLKRALVDDVDAFGKTEDFRTAFGDGLLTVEGETWREQRDLLSPYFFRERIGGYTDRMAARTDRRLDRWSPGDRIDAEAELSALALEILFSALFGRELALDGDAALRRSANGLNGWFKPTSWVLPEWVPTPSRRRFHRSVERLRGEVDRLIERRERTGAEGEDLLSKLVRARDHVDLPEETIKDQLLTFIFAGHETTAKAMTFTLYFLARNPGIREQVEAEADAMVAGEGAPTLTDLDGMDALDRALRESMRLYPPVHTIPRRTTEPVEVDGYRVPAGEEVHLSVYGVHRNAGVYEGPGQFRPSRWTDEVDRHDFAYVPFGGGRRSCIGREFALTEAKVVLGTICSRYRLEWLSEESIEVDPQVTTGVDGEATMVVHER